MSADTPFSRSQLPGDPNSPKNVAARGYILAGDPRFDKASREQTQ